ncbi:MAG: hypothetical protein R2783_04685 [Gelidibacter sp.]
MKTYIKTILYSILIMAVTSCSIDDIKPTNQLTNENAIRDEVSPSKY